MLTWLVVGIVIAALVTTTVARRSRQRFQDRVPLRTEPARDGVQSLLHEAPRRGGPRPIGLVLKVWDGSWIEAAATDHRPEMLGPYRAVAINADLPRAPAPRHRS